MKSFNVFSVIGIALITSFFSVFYIGSMEQYKLLEDQLPFSFFYRLVGVSAIGLLQLAILIAINFLFDKVFMEKVDTYMLKKLTYLGSVLIISISVIGCIFFFFG